METWVCLLATLTATILCMTFSNKSKNFCDSVFISVGTLLNQEFNALERQKNRILSTTWLFFIVVITATYFGALTEHFAIKIARLPFNDLNSLGDKLQTGSFQIVTETLSDSFFIDVQRSNNPAFVKMRNAISKHQPKVLNSTDAVLNFVAKNHGWVFISTEQRLKVLTAELP